VTGLSISFEIIFLPINTVAVPIAAPNTELLSIIGFFVISVVVVTSTFGATLFLDYFLRDNYQNSIVVLFYVWEHIVFDNSCRYTDMFHS